ncbi:ABC transporter ATP-binding protein [Beggiatoa leptomitoformis]|uniref:ATP-binding cassette domain-containing protein n=1 Tax=Beggiatoa leptomitoformis TaxID=288004 RepID=A0A2N9YFU4_9GAMM|nr:ABC transporter ATP-binding protein [Beggiatoa leptomitoformis]AUI69378.1 ATP-binding cassette domain-containing protein [Beggiatoa leptomitoformis]QGX03721.1 ATP-binding cassette domain-containing protein [Beggiatoa leptomitoformis]
MNQAVEVIDVCKKFPMVSGYSDFFLQPLQKKYMMALQDVNLVIPNNELFCILGANGAGKTTLLKILCTLMLPNSGTVLIQGLDVVQHASQIKRLIGYVLSDERSFYWRLTGRQNLQFFARLQNLSPTKTQQKIQALSQSFELSRQLDAPFQTYSTGMRRKLSFIRGLLTDPPLILMDEPSNALDSLSAEQVWQYIREVLINQQGKTVIITEHNLSKVERFADRFAILKNGEIKAVATPHELRQQLTPKNCYQLVLQQPTMGLLHWLATSCEIQQQTVQNDGNLLLEIVFTSPQINYSAWLADLLAVGGRVLSFSPVSHSLENIFSAYYQDV